VSLTAANSVNLSPTVRRLRTAPEGTLLAEHVASLHFERTLTKARVRGRGEDDAIYWIRHSLRGHPDASIARPLEAITLKGYVDHLHFHCLRNGLPSPITARVRAELNEALVNYGTRAPQKRPITIDELRLMIRSLDLSQPYGLRMRAMLLFAYESAQRAREWLYTQAHDLTFDPEHGYMARFTAAKNNPSGKPRFVPIRFAKDKELCPVLALQAWLQRMDIRSGPVFTQISSNRRWNNPQLKYYAARHALLLCARRAGVATKGLSFTSFRAGRMTLATERGQTMATIRRRSLHLTNRHAGTYIRGLAMDMQDYDEVLEL